MTTEAAKLAESLTVREALDELSRQAEELGHSELRELQELSLHGLLHLLGYDHESDDGAMDRLELELRDELLQR